MFFRAMTRSWCWLATVLMIFVVGNLPAAASSIGIDQLSAFIASSQLDPDPTDLTLNALEDTRIGSGLNEFQAAGLGVVFTNNLDANNLGSVTWTVTNNTGEDLTNVWFFGFLDAEIDELVNSAFNEFGALVRVNGAGSGDSAPDSWEIDEPGFSFGDIFDNLLAGSLDNTNSVPAASPEDVSLALGFDIGDVPAGNRIIATFQISQQDIGGLSQTDPNSHVTFFFNGSVTVGPPIVSAPEPGILWLLGTGLVALLGVEFLKTRANHSQQWLFRS